MVTEGGCVAVESSTNSRFVLKPGNLSPGAEMKNYSLAILLLLFLPSVSQAQSGSRSGPSIAPAIPQGSGSRVQSPSTSAPGRPSFESISSDEDYSALPSPSDSLGTVIPDPYSDHWPAYGPAPMGPCECLQPCYVPVRIHHVRPVYHRPYFGWRHRCTGY